MKSPFHPSNPNHLAAVLSPLCKPVPTITPFRFGYTGPHNRRGGTGDRTGRSYAGGPSGAAQKMVCPLTKGVRVSHTYRSGSSQEHRSGSPQTDRSCAEKHTERDTPSVTYKKSIRGTRRVPPETRRTLRHQGRTPSSCPSAVRISFTIGAGIWRKIRFLFVLLLTHVQKENKLKT